MKAEERSSKSAKMLYRPIGLVGSLFAGVLASQIFGQIYKRVTAGENADPPKALESEYALRDVLIAATIQGAIFACIKALMNRGGARAFQRWTGEWPGD